MANASIQDVSDTAFWVAHYRAEESERPDALFRDPLARVLLGDRGQAIAADMGDVGGHTRQNVLMRTVIIDRLIEELVRDGAKSTGAPVDCVVNLGAGLDTRPYRLDLPEKLRWVEVDYPHMIALKNERLKDEKPRVRLERLALDLADRDKRRGFFARLGVESTNVLVLTEGVLPYLTEAQVSDLAEDLHAEAAIKHWVAEYLHPMVYKYLRTPERQAKMKNAPFLFFPKDWFGFFESRGWRPGRVDYVQEEAAKRGRALPVPWWAPLIRPFTPKSVTDRFLKMSGYMLMRRF